jgi:serine kinase of HPr protein (carbohydrate metabolism regulator)
VTTADDPVAEAVHATCVACAGQGVILTGPSGSGKSDLALRLISDVSGDPFRLVADDLVRIEPRENRPIALAPPRLAGLIEVRGMGFVHVPSVDSAPVVLAVALRPWSEIERYPGSARKRMTIAGLSVPLIEIDATSPSAVARVRLALDVQKHPERLFDDGKP